MNTGIQERSTVSVDVRDSLRSCIPLDCIESASFFAFSKGLNEYIYQDVLPWNLFDIYS